MEENSKIYIARQRRGNQKMGSLQELIKQLPSELQEEVRDFVEFLLEKRLPKVKTKKGELKLDWRGALRGLRDKYTSVELQHKIF